METVKERVLQIIKDYLPELSAVINIWKSKYVENTTEESYVYEIAKVLNTLFEYHHYSYGIYYDELKELNEKTTPYIYYSTKEKMNKELMISKNLFHILQTLSKEFNITTL